jgi:hypothetical protein
MLAAGAEATGAGSGLEIPARLPSEGGSRPVRDFKTLTYLYEFSGSLADPEDNSDRKSLDLVGERQFLQVLYSTKSLASLKGTFLPLFTFLQCLARCRLYIHVYAKMIEYPNRRRRLLGVWWCHTFLQ